MSEAGGGADSGAQVKTAAVAGKRPRTGLTEAGAVTPRGQLTRSATASPPRALQGAASESLPLCQEYLLSIRQKHPVLAA